MRIQDDGSKEIYLWSLKNSVQEVFVRKVRKLILEVLLVNHLSELLECSNAQSCYSTNGAMTPGQSDVYLAVRIIFDYIYFLSQSVGINKNYFSSSTVR